MEVIKVLKGTSLFFWPFKRLMTALFSVAVRKRFGDITEQQFESEVKIWFRQAQLRYNREMAKLQ